MYFIWNIFFVWLDMCYRGYLFFIKLLFIIICIFYELNLLKGNFFLVINLKWMILENFCNIFVLVLISNLMGCVDLMNKFEFNLNILNFYSDLIWINNEKIEF